MSLIPKKTNTSDIIPSQGSLSAKAAPANPAQVAATSNALHQISSLIESRNQSLEHRLSSLPKHAQTQLDPLQPIGTKKAQKPAQREKSPPAVRNRSPPREPQVASTWKIPAAISNWKNESGNLVPLSDRVAASTAKDKKSVNRKFLEFATELYEAETEARIQGERKAEAERLREIEQAEKKEEEVMELERQTLGTRGSRDPSDTFSSARRELMKETLKEYRRRGAQKEPGGASIEGGDSLFDPRIFARSAASDDLYQRPLFAQRQPLYAADRRRLAEAGEQLDAVARDGEVGPGLPVQFDRDVEVKRGEDEPQVKRRRTEHH